MKKKLAATLSVVLILGLAALGILAYLTDTDSDVNVMTLGNVDIEQHEYQRATKEDGTYITNTIDYQTSYVLEAFEQGKPLLPIVGDPSESEDSPAYAGYDTTATVRMSQVDSYGGMDVFAGKNAVDKFVTVENTGRTDAYVRTLVAIEVGDTDGSLIGTSHHFTWDDPAEIGIVNIDGNNYFIKAYVYKGWGNNRHVGGILPAGDTTYPNLSQVYIKHNATNEDMNAIDGNGNGALDILVLSQAVQTAGFENATEALKAGFGEVTKENVVKWFTSIPVGFEVSNNAELAAAIEAGETEIWLNQGTYNAPAVAKGKTLTINGTKESVLEVAPAGQSEAGGQLDYSFDGSTVEFNGVTIKTNSKTYAGYARLSGTYNNCVIQNTYNLGVGNSEFNKCVFNITNEYLRVGGAYKATFDGCTFNTDGRAILVFQDGTKNDQVVTVKDCTFNATAAAYTWDNKHVAAVSFDGSQGGTYTVNFEGNNVVDSDFNGLWQDKTNAGNVTVNGLK